MDWSEVGRRANKAVYWLADHWLLDIALFVATIGTSLLAEKYAAEILQFEFAYRRPVHWGVTSFWIWAAALLGVALIKYAVAREASLGAIRQLRWADVDVNRSNIRWRAETDKKGKEWVIPIPASLVEELKTFRVKMGGLFGGFIFPSATDPTKPVTRDSFGHLLAAAERKAKLPKLDGSLWHAYRRAWATTRKGLPVVDVAAAGGWSDIGTLMKCYQQADDVTLLEVMSHSKKISSEARAG